MNPKDVNKSNENQVWNTIYRPRYAETSLPQYKVGDLVRIYRYKSVFTKGYEANFTEELFKIRKVIRGDPNVYELEDLDGEPIIGKFYEQELSVVDKKDDSRINWFWGDRGGWYECGMGEGKRLFVECGK